MSNRKPSRAGICFKWRSRPRDSWGCKTPTPITLLLQASMVPVPQAWSPHGRGLFILLSGSKPGMVTAILGELLRCPGAFPWEPSAVPSLLGPCFSQLSL